MRAVLGPGRTGAFRLLSVVAMCAALAGCGGSHKQAHARNPTQRMSFQLAADTQPIAANVPSQPIGTTPTSFAGLQLRLYVLHRLGPQAALVIYGFYTAPGTTIGVGDETEIQQAMSATGLSNSGETALSDVSLVDPVGLKQYLVYQAQPTNPATCVCSLFPNVSIFQPGTTTYFAAVTSAPPPGVSSVSFVTGLGTIGNVSMSG